MSKWDARNRSRVPGHNASRAQPQPSHIPIVRGSVQDKDEWSALRQNGLAGPEEALPWETSEDADGIDLPLPDMFDDEALADEQARPGLPPPAPSVEVGASSQRAPAMPVLARASSPAPIGVDPAANEERASLDALPLPEFESSPDVTTAAPTVQDPAAIALEQLCAQTPEDVTRRGAVLQACLDAGLEDKVREHLAWLLQKHVQAEHPAEACGVFRHVRERMPSLALDASTLVAALDAAHASEDGVLVVEATKLLVSQHPTSPEAPRALATTAGYQLAGGRADLAKGTLQYLATSYPADRWAEIARRKLETLG